MFNYINYFNLDKDNISTFIHKDYECLNTNNICI